MASRGAAQPREGMSALLNNIQAIKDQFRKQEKRIALFEKKIKKNHRSQGNENFKVKLNHYFFDKQKQHRYKTPNLKLREIHKSLKGVITRTQIAKDKFDLTHPPGEATSMPTFNDIKNYPDTRQPILPDQMIENVNEMIEEEAKYQDDEWQKELSQSGSDYSSHKKPVILQRDSRFKFSLGEKLRSILQEKVSKELEHEQNLKLKKYQLNLEEVLSKDVTELYDHRQFKDLMSEDTQESMLNDVATRMMQQFKAQMKCGVQKPVPNLSLNPNSIKADSKEMQELFENLLFVLRSSDREQYMALRDGKLSLKQLCRNLCEQQFGKTYTVMDDIIDEGKLLQQPGKYVVAAFNQLQLETKLLKHAQKRGVDKKVLKDTAPNISLQAKCVRSIHSKAPKRRTESNVDHFDKTAQVLQTKQAQDKVNRQDLVQRQAEKWENFEQKKGQTVKIVKKLPYQKEKIIQERFNHKLPKELHESFTRDYKAEYSRQIKVKTERAAALRPWRVNQNPADDDVTKSQKIAPREKIIYESMPESHKEKLEDCKEALFLIRMYEDDVEGVLQMPIRFAFQAERPPQIKAQPQVQELPSANLDFISNPSEVMLVVASEKKPDDYIKEAMIVENFPTLPNEEGLKEDQNMVEGPQTVTGTPSCDSFQKIQLRKELSPSPLMRIKESLLRKSSKTAVVVKIQRSSSSTEDEKQQSSNKLLNSSIIKQLLEMENQEYITERFRPKSAMCPTSTVQRHRLLVNRKTEFQCNNIADFKDNKDHRQFLNANMRQGAYSGSLIQNSFANTSRQNQTPKQADEFGNTSRHIVMQGQMMNKYRPNTMRPRTQLCKTKHESMATVKTQRNTPFATSSIQDYELKTSQVPSSVVNWFQTNIIGSQRSQVVVRPKSLVVNAKPKFGRLKSAKGLNEDLQKSLGSYDSNNSLESAPFVKGFVIQNQATPSLGIEDLILESGGQTTVSGFNWLTGAKMGIGKNINIPSKVKITDPILKQKKSLQKVSTLMNDFVNYPAAIQPNMRMLLVDRPDQSTEMKGKQSLNLRSEDLSVIDL